MGVEIVKSVACFVGGLCSAQVVNTIVKTFEPSNINKIQKVGWIVGGALIGGAVGAKCEEYVEETIDAVQNIVDKLKGNNQESVEVE